jgi:hypothetical protein
LEKSTNLVDHAVNEVGFFLANILEPHDLIGFLVLAKHVLSAGYENLSNRHGHRDRLPGDIFCFHNAARVVKRGAARPSFQQPALAARLQSVL